MRKAFALAVALSFLLSHAAGAQKVFCADRNQLLIIAAEEVRRSFPDTDAPVKWEPVIEDKGEEWEISYRVPPGTVGVTPVVLIDKVSCKVIVSYRELQ